MPTFDAYPSFAKDIKALDERDRKRFRQVVVEQFVPDLAAGARFRSSLRVKAVWRAPGVFEMTWAPDGRATFEFGKEIKVGVPHIIWRRTGTHEVFRSP